TPKQAGLTAITKGIGRVADPFPDPRRRFGMHYYSVFKDRCPLGANVKAIALEASCQTKIDRFGRFSRLKLLPLLFMPLMRDEVQTLRARTRIIHRPASLPRGFAIQIEAPARIEVLPRVPRRCARFRTFTLSRPSR